MRNKMKQAVLLVSVLPLILAACGATPTLELEDRPFRDQANGYSIRYPEGWEHVYLERVSGRVFYQSGEPIEEIVALRAVGKVPVLLIIAGPLDAVPYVSLDDVHDSKTMIRAFLAWLGDAQDGRVGRIRTGAVAGKDGAVAEIRWSQGETKMAGRAAAVYLGDRGLFIEGAGSADSWKAFEPTFKDILDSAVLH